VAEKEGRNGMVRKKTKKMLRESEEGQKEEGKNWWRRRNGM
jgi:hypothetical protein